MHNYKHLMKWNEKEVKIDAVCVLLTFDLRNNKQKKLNE